MITRGLGARWIKSRMGLCFQSFARVIRKRETDAARFPEWSMVLV